MRKKNKKKLNVVPAKMEIMQEESLGAIEDTPEYKAMAAPVAVSFGESVVPVRINTGYKDRNNDDIYVGNTLRSLSKADTDRYKVCRDEHIGRFMVMDSSGDMIASLSFFLRVGTESASSKAKAEIVKEG